MGATEGEGQPSWHETLTQTSHHPRTISVKAKSRDWTSRAGRPGFVQGFALSGSVNLKPETWTLKFPRPLTREPENTTETLSQKSQNPQLYTPESPATNTQLNSTGKSPSYIFRARTVNSKPKTLPAPLPPSRMTVDHGLAWSFALLTLVEDIGMLVQANARTFTCA